MLSPDFPNLMSIGSWSTAQAVNPNIVGGVSDELMVNVEDRSVFDTSAKSAYTQFMPRAMCRELLSIIYVE